MNTESINEDHILYLAFKRNLTESDCKEMELYQKQINSGYPNRILTEDEIKIILDRIKMEI
jgi:hypothetical protein